MVYIIAEAGIDHEGYPYRLTELFDAAVKAKVDAFKIQYYAEGFKGAHRTLPWLDPSYILALKEDCHNYDMEFIITPHDKWAVDLILNTECVDKVKIGSGDWALLQYFAPEAELIISCGKMDRRRVIHEMVDRFNAHFLYCVSEYPAPVGHIDLREIHNMYVSMSPWGSGLIGYSDHSIGQHVCIAAVAKGASIIEKHMTLERNVEGRNDTFGSLLPDEWPGFVETLRETEICCA